MVTIGITEIEPLYPEMVGLSCIYCNYVFEPTDNPIIKRHYNIGGEEPTLGYFGCRLDCYTNLGHVFGSKKGKIKFRRRGYAARG